MNSITSPSGTRNRQWQAVEGLRSTRASAPRPAGAGIHGFILAGMRSAEGAEDVLPRALCTGKGSPAAAQPLEGRPVESHAPALFVGRERPTHVRSLAPAKSQPAQILEHRFDELRPASCAVEVVVAQDQRAARFRAASQTQRGKSLRVRDAKSPWVTVRGVRGSGGPWPASVFPAERYGASFFTGFKSVS